TSVVVLRAEGRSFCAGYDIAPNPARAARRHNALVWHESLTDDIPSGATVIVRYRRRPFLIAPVYSLRPPEVSPTEPAEQAPVREVVVRPQAPSTSPDLVFGGTKSVSFSTGSNRGSTLDQSLEATVEGKLTPTISVRALLSDNNLPIQPEGNTEELEYFDRVFVEIEGPRARAAVGDISLDNRTSTFSPLVRQLRGFSGAAWSSQGRVTAAGAETKGEFRSVAFRGTTGLQGPYALLSPARTTLEVIIAGTERVSIDGVRVERGPNRDYLIDYDAGTVTFTPRRLITTDTEIAVDFEATAENYARSTLLGAAERVKLGGGVAMSVIYAREADDKSDSKSVSLTEGDLSVLAAAGDDADAAVTGGVTQTDPGQGDYVLVPADTVSGAPAFFRFDEVLGDYLVSFVEVAANGGAYRRAGISSTGTAYFEFVGDSLGSYVVGRSLPLPTSLDVATARIGRETGVFTFDAEWNVSQHDRNLLSSLDDDDNVGNAGQIRAGLESDGDWRLGISALASVLEDRFQSFDRSRAAYFYRDWNLEDVALVGREATQDVTVSAARTTIGSARVTASHLDRDDFEGWKQEAVLAAGRLDDRGLSARAFTSDTEGEANQRTRRHMTTEAAYGAWKVVPGITYGYETYRNAFDAAPDSGRAYELVGAYLASRSAARLSWRLGGEQRDTRTVDAATDDFVDARRDVTLSGSLVYRSSGAARAELQLIHRREDDLIAGGETKTDLARVKAGSAWDGIALRADADYEVSQNDAATLQRSVVFVGEGKGDYNAIGEPVGKGKGAYTVVFLPTTDTTPVHTVGFNLRIAWKPSQRTHTAGGFGGWILRNVSVDQTLGIREESTYEPAWEVYLMLPSALQRDDATVFGATTFRQDWSLLDGYKNVSLTVRFLREDREDNRFEGVHESAQSGERAARLSRSLSAVLTGVLEGGQRVDRRGGEGIPGGTGSSYDADEWFALVGAGIVLAPGANLDVDVRGATLSDAESGAEQRSLKVTPRLVWRIADQLNLFGTYELAQVNNQGETAVQPLVFAREGTSQRWSITPNIRISNIIGIFATYSGRNERVFTGQRVVEHEFRLETRAYF
ncbi:MAG: hypothetical protein L0Z51_03145, partial [Candidatus Latescibacteria bacterium]|nr:hypothetical protein [Candidatus Latescibacterota bacterium]